MGRAPERATHTLSSSSHQGRASGLPQNVWPHEPSSAGRDTKVGEGSQTTIRIRQRLTSQAETGHLPAGEAGRPKEAKPPASAWPHPRPAQAMTCVPLSPRGPGTASGPTACEVSRPSLQPVPCPRSSSGSTASRSCATGAPGPGLRHWSPLSLSATIPPHCRGTRPTPPSFLPTSMPAVAPGTGTGLPRPPRTRSPPSAVSAPPRAPPSRPPGPIHSLPGGAARAQPPEMLVTAGGNHPGRPLPPRQG